MVNRSLPEWDLGSFQQTNTPTDVTSGYANSADLLRDPRFLTDLRRHYEKKGVSRETDEELIDRFYSDNTWSMMNTVSAVKEAGVAATANAEDKSRLNRLQQAWTSLPNFWQEGGRGFMEAASDALPAILADPINLIPGVNAYAKGTAAARAAVAAGKGGLRAGTRAGIRSGAISEGIISGGQEALIDTASQVRDIQLGLADDFSFGRLGTATGIGATVGSGIGGTIGGIAGRFGARKGADQASNLSQLGYSPDEIANMSNVKAASRIPPEMPDYQMPDGRQQQAEEAPVTEPTAEEALEMKWNAETEKVTAMRNTLRERIRALQNDASPETEQMLADLTARRDLSARLVSMADRLRAEEAEIIKFGGTSDTSQLAKHERRVQQFEQDYAEFQNIVDQVEDAQDTDAINGRIDQYLQTQAERRAAEAEGEAPETTTTTPEGGGTDTTTTPEGDPPAPEATATTSEPIETAPAEKIEWSYRSANQQKSVEKLLKDTGKTNDDIQSLVDQGILKVSQNGQLQRPALKAMREHFGDKINTQKAEEDAPEAVSSGSDTDAALDAMADPEGISVLQGEALLSGVDYNQLTPSKRSKTGKITNAQIKKAIVAKEKELGGVNNPDPYAEQVKNEYFEILEMLGPMDDPDLVRKAVRALAVGAKSEDKDIMSLHDYAYKALSSENLIREGTDSTDTPVTAAMIRASIKKLNPDADDATVDKIAAALKKASKDQRPPPDPKDPASIRGTGEAIEAAHKFTTAGRNITNQIQGFLKRGTRIGRDSDYTVTAGYQVKRGQLGFEEALVRASEGLEVEEPLKGNALKKAERTFNQMVKNGVDEEKARSMSGLMRGQRQKPSIVEYETKGRETVIGPNGPVEVPKGTTAFADAVTRRAYESMELALEYRNYKEGIKKKTDDPKGENLVSKPEKTQEQLNVAALFKEFGSDPDAFRKALQAARKAETSPEPATAKRPLKRGDKYLIIRHKETGELRMINPKQAKDGGDIKALVGKKDPDEFEAKFADAEQFTTNKNKLQKVWDAAPLEADDVGYALRGSTEGMLTEAGYATSLGEPMPITQAHSTAIQMADLSQEETIALSFALGKSPAHIGKSVSLSTIANADLQLTAKRWRATVKDHQAVAKAAATLNELVYRYAPNGIEPDGVWRKASIESLNAIFSNHSSEQLAGARRFLERLGGDKRIGPHIETQQQLRGASGSIDPATQDLGFPPDTKATNQKSVSLRLNTLYHEVAHWAYTNVLTPKDRAEFWRATEKFYDAQGNFDGPSIPELLPKYGHNNGMETPAELFANQFDLYATRRVMPDVVADEKYWQRIVNYVKGVFDRYMNAGAKIDPDLEPLLAKILPPEEASVFGMGRDAKPTTPAGETYNRRYAQIQMDRQDLLDALADDSPERVVSSAQQILRTMLELAPSVYHSSKEGTTGTLMPLLPMRQILRSRIDDLSEIISGKPFDFDEFERSKEIPRWARDDGFSLIEDPTKVADLIRDFYSNGYLGEFKPSKGIPAAKSGKPINLKHTNLKKALDMMEMRLEGAYRAAEQGNLPPDAKPKLDGDAPPSAKPNKIRRRSQVKQARMSAAIEAEAKKTASTPSSKRKKRDPKKSRTVDPSFAEDLKSKNINALKKLLRDQRGTDRGDQVALELVRKLKARPLPAKQVPVSREVMEMDVFQLAGNLTAALANKETKLVDMISYEITRRGLKKKGLPPVKPLILRRDILDQEIEDNIGLASSDGIPPATRASIREMLGYITHRDPEVQYTARTMAYRMMNLMGKTARGVMGEANVMTSSDMAKLAGVDPNVVGSAAFADFRSPEFGKMRSDFRRLSIALTKGQTSPFDIMHELGHTMVRSGVLEGDELKAIREAYTLADDAIKDTVKKRYSTKYAGRTEPLDDLLAEEWFAEGLSVYMAERIAKGDILDAALGNNIGNLRLRGEFSRAIDRVIEYISYLLNGVVGRNDIKQQYRRLFLYGDMFEGVERAPMSDVVRDHRFVSASYAKDAVADHIFNSPSARLEKIKSFVADGESIGANGKFIEFYHGTPVGQAFDRSKNPDVVLEPSRHGRFGRGVYLTKSPVVAEEVYSKMPTMEGYARQIEELLSSGKIDEETASMMKFAAGDITAIRHQLSKIRRTYSFYLKEGQSEQSLINQKERIDNLIEEEQELVKFLSDEGIETVPLVLPTFVRVRNAADFRQSAIYTPNDAGTPDAFVQMFIRRAEMDPQVDPDMLAEFVDDMQTRAYGGQDIYDSLIELYSSSGMSNADAADKITRTLEDEGYDAIKSTHSNTLGIEGTEITGSGITYEASPVFYEALTVFKSSNVKHVDADEFNDFDSRLFYRASEAMPKGTLGAIGEGILNRNINKVSDINPGSLGEVLEKDGVSSSMTSAIMSMVRGRKLDVKEEQAMRKVSPMWWLQSQSDRMENLGASWIARWYKDNFPDLHQKFAAKYFPIHHKLRALPDADGKVRSWARAATAGISQEQPASYRRIVSALRRGIDEMGQESRQVKALKPAERKIWEQIRNAFGEERRELIAKGIHVGDRGPNYLPQVWNPEKIRKNKDEFLEKMENYFRVEKESKGFTDYTDDEAREFAFGLFETLAEDGADGVFVPIMGGSRNPKFDNVDFSRVIELEKYPTMLNELEKFLESDLEALLIKYFEGSSRRLAHTEQMGVNSHAFYDYILAAETGRNGMVRLLTTPKDFRKDIRAISETGYPEYAQLSDVVAMPFQGNEVQAGQFVDDMILKYNQQGSGAARQMLETIAPKDPDGNIPLAYKRRADAMIGALEDFKGNKAPWKENDYNFLEQAMRVAMKKPMLGSGGTGMMNFSKKMRTFNAVTLLGFTTLTSLGDVVLPVIRSGSVTDWAKGLHNWKRDPDYAQFIHDTGVAMENIVHERMVHMYGAADGKLTNAFFNATMLTPWTDMNRQIAGATGYETFKTMQRRAFSSHKEGVGIEGQPWKYREAARYLKSYGLGDFLPDGTKKNMSLSEYRMLEKDEMVRKAIIKFADQTIFQPNANDVPLWAQTPFGALVFQLKSFPLMMMRLGGHTIREFKRGNVKPLLYLATLGPAFGMATLSVKDIVQRRGGDDERSPELRQRNILKTLGYDEKIHGSENDFLGWYVEGMMMMGGLGLLGDIMHSAVTQVDNGAYGKVRIAGTIAGPSFGTFMSSIDVAAGVQDAVVGGGNSNAKERTAVRETANRIPVAGGIRSLREGIVDRLAGEPSSGRKSNPWKTSFESGWK